MSTREHTARLRLAKLVAVFGIVVIGINASIQILHGVFAPRKEPTRQVVKEEPTGTTAPDVTFERTRGYANRLASAGWAHDAAESVVELNAEWFDIQAEENPAGLEIQLKYLVELGKHRDLHGFLVEHPETAGLLASASDPQLVAESLRFASNDGDYHRVAGLYVQHAAPGDAADLALALKANHDLICMLHRRGLLGCEVLFIFDRDTLAASEYEAWLRDVFTAKCAASDEELASFANLIMCHGPGIRERMQQHDKFRVRFRRELWPRLARVVASEQGAFEPYLDDDRIWVLLARDNGEELLRHCGLLPIDLLYGYPEIDHPPYPESLHEQIVQLLLRREELAINSLMKFRGEPQFHKLLQRDLASDTRSAALGQLFKAGASYPQTLAYFERLSDSALAEEVGPPPSGIITWVPFYYTLWEVPRKRMQGREPTDMELFSALADPLFLVFDLATLPVGGGTAAGRRVLVSGGREVAERTAKEMTEKGVQKVFVTTLRDAGLELAKKRLGRDVAETLSGKELVGWTVSGMLAQTQRAVRSTIGKATTLEITRPVQLMFHYSGVGRETWQRWTGLEARLFMRGDSRVFVRVGNLPVAILGARSTALLNRAAQDLSIGAVAESEPGQDVLRGGVRQVLSAKEQFRTWQQSVSAWWLLNASVVGNSVASPRRSGKMIGENN